MDQFVLEQEQLYQKVNSNPTQAVLDTCAVCLVCDCTTYTEEQPPYTNDSLSYNYSFTKSKHDIVHFLPPSLSPSPLACSLYLFCSFSLLQHVLKVGITITPSCLLLPFSLPQQIYYKLAN